MVKADMQNYERLVASSPSLQPGRKHPNPTKPALHATEFASTLAAPVENARVLSTPHSSFEQTQTRNEHMPPRTIRHGESKVDTVPHSEGNPAALLYQPDGNQIRQGHEHLPLEQLFTELELLELAAKNHLDNGGQIPPATYLSAFGILHNLLEAAVPEQESRGQLAHYLEIAVQSAKSGNPMPSEMAAEACSTISDIVAAAQENLFWLASFEPVPESPANFAIGKPGANLIEVEFEPCASDIVMPIPGAKTEPQMKLKSQKLPRGQTPKNGADRQAEPPKLQIPKPSSLIAKAASPGTRNISPKNTNSNSPYSEFFGQGGGSRGSKCVVSTGSTAASSHSSSRCTKSKNCLGGNMAGGIATHPMHFRNSIKVMDMLWNWIAWIGVLRQIGMLSRR